MTVALAERNELGQVGAGNNLSPRGRAGGPAKRLERRFTSLLEIALKKNKGLDKLAEGMATAIEANDFSRWEVRFAMERLYPMPKPVPDESPHIGAPPTSSEQWSAFASAVRAITSPSDEAIVVNPEPSPEQGAS